MLKENAFIHLLHVYIDYIKRGYGYELFRLSYGGKDFVFVLLWFTMLEHVNTSQMDPQAELNQKRPSS